MPRDDFRTVGDELLHVATAAETHFLDQGYTVGIEQKRIGYPFTPTLLCERGHETVIVEVSSTIDLSRTDRWIKFCRSQTRDIGLCVVLRSTEPVDQQTIIFAQENRLGLCTHDDQILLELRTPSDLAVHVELPKLSELPSKIRPMLAPAFRKIQENDWRDGLNHAYNEIEQHARDYLKEGIRTGRLTIIVGRQSNQVALQETDVEAMTLGQLKDAFKRIQLQTHKDAVIGTTLDMINKTRIGLAHRRRSASVETELRLQVGQHMYAAIDCLEELIS